MCMHATKSNGPAACFIWSNAYARRSSHTSIRVLVRAVLFATTTYRVLMEQLVAICWRRRRSNKLSTVPFTPQAARVRGHLDGSTTKPLASRHVSPECGSRQPAKHKPT